MCSKDKERLIINDIIGKRVNEARIARGYSIQELADKIGINKQSLSRYENGINNISIEKLILIADILKFPLEFFRKNLQGSLIDKDTVFFRSSNASRVKIKDTLSKNIKLIEEIYLELNKYIYFPEFLIEDIKFEYKIGISKLNIEKIANMLREAWNLGSKPIDNMINILERHGVLVSKIELYSQEVDAFSYKLESGRPIIIIGSDKKSAARLRFDCAHELGHIILHSHLSKEEKKANHSRLEKEADMFASAFLLPAEDFVNDLYSVSLDTLIYMKRKWRVSLASMIVRSYELNIITKGQYTYLFKRLSAKGWRLNEPLDNVLEYEEPRLLKEAFELLINNRIVTVEELVNQIALLPEEIEKLCFMDYGYLTRKIKYNKSILRVIK